MSIEVLLIPLALAALAGGARMMQEAAPESVKTSSGLSSAIQARSVAKDRRMLEEALVRLGSSVTVDEETLAATLEGREILFAPDAEGVYWAKADAGAWREQFEHLLSSVDQEYGRQVQLDVYRKVIARAAERGLQLEMEQRDGDNSIVLTFVIQETH
jgi:hypothetical protein